MNKTCQNCKADFIIEPDDQSFYDKVQVPPPTFCWECRMQRRIAFRNERSLYKATCQLCNKSIIASYSPESEYIIYCKECWYSDGWDPLEYGVDYDFAKPFFTQFKELQKRVPHMNTMQVGNNVNTEFANYVANSKNIYLSYSIPDSENISYSRAVDNSRDCIDCMDVDSCELSYECNEAGNINRSRYISRGSNVIDCAFLFDVVNCQNCFMSTGLKNANYVFRNEQLSKEAYQDAMNNINLGSHAQIEQLIKEFDTVKSHHVKKYANVINIVNSTGDNIINTKNVQYVFDTYNSEDLKYAARLFDMRDTYDIYGATKAELLYEGIALAYNDYMVRFAIASEACRDTHYTDFCISSDHIFGGVSLRNKSYCILNKQYTKEEYEEIVPKIKQHMMDMPYKDSAGREYRYGEYYPIELSPYAYNEAIVNEYYPMTKEDIIKNGYRYKEQEEKGYNITLQGETIPDDINDVTDDILQQTIGCDHKGQCQDQCTTAFRITTSELQFYKRMNIPIPHLCPNCRHYQRISRRNMFKLYSGSCHCAGVQSDSGVYKNKVNSHPPHDSQTHCPNTFQTPYQPGGKHIVYCEQCYLAEVV